MQDHAHRRRASSSARWPAVATSAGCPGRRRRRCACCPPPAATWCSSRRSASGRPRSRWPRWPTPRSCCSRRAWATPSRPPRPGILEVADVFVVNKADRDGADRVVSDLRHMQSLGPRSPAQAEVDGEWVAPVVKTVAARGEGADEVVDRDRGARRVDGRDGRPRAAPPPARAADEVEAIALTRAARPHRRPAWRRGPRRAGGAGRRRQLDPYAAARRLVDAADGVQAGLRPRGTATARAGGRGPGARPARCSVRDRVTLARPVVRPAVSALGRCRCCSVGCAQAHPTRSRPRPGARPASTGDRPVRRAGA